MGADSWADTWMKPLSPLSPLSPLCLLSLSAAVGRPDDKGVYLAGSGWRRAERAAGHGCSVCLPLSLSRSLEIFVSPRYSFDFLACLWLI